MDISKFDQRQKCIFALKIGERASLYFKEENVIDLIKEALEIACGWIQSGNNVGEILYNYLDNEENGFTIFQETEEDEIIINAWNCIIDAIAYVSRAAYEREGEKYMPEPIEMVDDNVLEHMKHSLILCDSKEKLFIEDLYQRCLQTI